MLKTPMMKATKLLAVIAVSLAVAQLLLVLLSWVISAAVPNAPLRSLLSSEGIRWFFGHFTQNLATPVLVWLLLGSVAYGAYIESGLRNALLHPRSLTFRERFALRVSYVIVGVFVLVLLLLTAVPHAVLLSVTGDLFPSSFSDSFVAVVCFVVSVSSVVFGVMSGRLKGIVSIFDVLTVGVTYTSSLWILYVLAAELYFSVLFVFMR
jgi:aminobenzoyl-glutamate transport protein